jgi:gamma-glutamyl hercynylcysteine S-oxide synthase
MRYIIKRSVMISVLISVFAQLSFGQDLLRINLTKRTGILAESFAFKDSTLIKPDQAHPVFSFRLDGVYYTSADVDAGFVDDSYTLGYNNGVQVLLRPQGVNDGGWKAEVTFWNRGNDTVLISDIVPFGEGKNSVFITGAGPWDLARAWLNRPGFRPVRVILPDNAWEMGYSSFSVSDIKSVTAIARRVSVENATRRRYETELPPNGKVVYNLFAEVYSGAWQDGLRIMFRDRLLYDIPGFDNTLFERDDLKWIKSSYLIVLQYPWDIEYYDRFTGKYTYQETLRKYNEKFGHIDVFGIWPTWPRLGLDQRNQWDMYRDLPGGLEQLRSFSRLSRQYNTKFFIAYNPWDNSTRKEDHYQGMADLIRQIEADGVVLDTRGASSYELQHAADSVRSGVVMYSEGMAIVKDMPGIISGRVHNAIFLSPELNLNKLIKPDFAIFRVGDVGEARLKREIAISFFNGYGTELNMFRPGGRDHNFESDMDFLAMTTEILRQNSKAFVDQDFTPMLHTTTDNIYVNRWRDGQKTIFTVLNMSHEGFSGNLFEDDFSEGFHYVSLWSHEEVLPIPNGNRNILPVNTGGWQKDQNGTRGEGSVDCIARFPELINSEILGDNLMLKTGSEGDLRIWKGNPGLTGNPVIISSPVDTLLDIKKIFGYYEGKIVIQLLANGNLIDERVMNKKGGIPWLISQKVTTNPVTSLPASMVLVPAAIFSYKVSVNDDFIPHPEIDKIRNVKVDSFLIDRYPVTNASYYDFVRRTGYMPVDTTNYLRHWSGGVFKTGQGNYPVVYIGYEDAMAYAKWAGKRLPTENEWQLAAQGTDGRIWPWGEEFFGTRCNNAFDRPTPVDAFTKGASPYGVNDLVGNVWQMTGDIWFNGNNYFLTIRGGSYYKPESSWWYIQGGPQPLNKTQMLLLVSPGFDRSATVGFRCVSDIDPNTISLK